MKIDLEGESQIGTGAALGDVAFLLLVFMMTLMNSSSDKKVELPEFLNSEVFKDSKVETLSVTKDGFINFREKDMGQDDFLALLDGVEADTPIKLYADKDTRFIYLVEVMQLIKEQGDHRLILMNKPPPKDQES